MDRLEFLQALSGDIGCTDIITRFFDQYMLMYDILDHVEKISATDSNGYFSIIVSYKNKKNINELIAKLGSIPNPISIYESRFMISYNQIDTKSVMISLAMI